MAAKSSPSTVLGSNLNKMFVIEPDPYLSPVFRISPFRTADMAVPIEGTGEQAADLFRTYCDQRFGPWQLTRNGREAIALALAHYKLKPSDQVSILTTSGNFYISGCVTAEIEKVCRWNRELNEETKLIFVNHEFGTVHPEMAALKATGLPIIEDCCTTFYSQDAAGKVGRYGDFALYSFPKFFPFQIGGLLVNNQKQVVGESALSAAEAEYLQKALGHYLSEEERLLVRRRFVYQYQCEAFARLGFEPFFDYAENQLPSVLMLANQGRVKDLPALKEWLWQHGIQSSVFYGEDAFYLPSHQNLSTADVKYFCSVLSHYLEHKNDH